MLSLCLLQNSKTVIQLGYETNKGETMEFQLFKFWAYSDDGYKGQISVISKTREDALIEAKRVATKHGMKLV